MSSRTHWSSLVGAVPAKVITCAPGRWRNPEIATNSQSPSGCSGSLPVPVACLEDLRHAELNKLPMPAPGYGHPTIQKYRQPLWTHVLHLDMLGWGNRRRVLETCSWSGHRVVTGNRAITASLARQHCWFPRELSVHMILLSHIRMDYLDKPLRDVYKPLWCLLFQNTLKAAF